MVLTSSNGARSLSIRVLVLASVLAFAVTFLPAAALADDAGALVLAVEDDAGEDDAAGGGGGGVGLGVLAAVVLMGLAFRQVSSRD